MIELTSCVSTPTELKREFGRCCDYSLFERATTDTKGEESIGQLVI